jgi:peptidylprolyl isomerase
MNQKTVMICLAVVALCASLVFLQCNSKRTNTMSNPIVVMETSQGTFEITLMPDSAPKACENFIGLVNKHYYDGVPFHRIIPQFMIQGGDPTGTGAGGQSIWGKPFADEVDHVRTVNFNTEVGLVAMANAGPNTNGSQFFITTAPTPWLNGNHTIFGKITSGYDVVKKLEAQGTQSGKPRSEQKIVKAYVK